MLSLRRLLVAVVVLVVATASVVVFSRPDRSITSIRTPETRESRVSISGPPFPDLSEFFTMLQRQHDDEVLQELADLAAFLKTLTVGGIEPVAPPAAHPALAAGGGGFPSDEWIYRLGRCEQPGKGPEGIAIDNRVGGYPGGFGFLPGAWARVRDDNWPESMADAPLAMQIEAVRRLGAIEGFVARVWGCINAIGPAY